MATATLLPPARAVFYDANGNPLAGGFVWTYVPGGTTPKTTWQDAGETTPNANPVPLDANGSCSLYGSGSYQLTVTDALGNAIPAYSGLTVDTSAPTASLSASFLNLTDPTQGSALVGYIPTYAGAVGQTVEAKLAQIINAADFGVTGNGTTDDTAALNAALTAAAPGQQVSLVGLGHCLVAAGNINIPAGVSLIGGWNTPGNTLSSASGGQATDLATLNGSIVLSSSYTINMAGASSLRGIPVYRQGLTTPATDATAFAGTAITVQGDDVYVGYCLVLGFAQLLTSTTNTRGKFEWIYGDNQAGLLIVNAYDTPYIHHCHFWPFVTYSASATLTMHHRTGTAFKVDGTALPSLSHCFSFAYLIGYELSGSGGAVLVDCQADNDAAFASTIGFSLGTPSAGVTSSKLIGCTAFNCATGYLVNSSVGDYVEFSSCSSDSCSAAVNVSSGDIRWIGGVWANATSGLTVVRDDSAVVLTALKTIAVTSAIVTDAGGSNAIYVDPSCDFDTSTPGTSISTTMITAIVASASPLLLPAFGDVYTITGTTAFGLIDGGWAGRKVTLIFNNIVTITTSTVTNGIRLSESINFATSPASTLSLVHNGTQWFETGRCT